MIKRDGFEIKSGLSGNAKIARDTLEIIKNKGYTSPTGQTVDISASLDAAVLGSIYYPDEIKLQKKDVIDNPIIEIFNETTAQAAVRLASLGKTDVVALNFAAANNPGGGFLAGATAQEEDLCRASGLYPCIKNKPKFYNANILTDDSYYTDGTIYSPNVPFFRDPSNNLLEKYFELSIITAPAPNVFHMVEPDKLELVAKIFSRIFKILSTAAHHNHKNIILGAWGCGAFGNNPYTVANAFMAGLEVIPYFEHVAFAVYDTRPELPLFSVFKEVVDNENCS